MAVPLRTCVACRRSTVKRELIRLVVARDSVQPDPSGSHPGRGAYVCGLARCIDIALKRDGAVIRRALRLGCQHVTLDTRRLGSQLGEMGDAQEQRRETSTSASLLGEIPGRAATRE